MLIGVIAEESLLPLVAAPNALFVDTDHLASGFYWIPSVGDYRPTVSVIGFLIPDLVDETAPLGDEKLPNNYVTNGYIGIWPDLYDDTVPEIFYSFTSGFEPALQPFPVFDFDNIYSVTIPTFPPIAPQLFHDQDIVYLATLYAGTLPDLFVDIDIIRENIIRRDGDPLTLLAEVFNDADAFFMPTMAKGLLPPLVTAADIIYAAMQANSPLAPSAFSSDDTIFSAFVVDMLAASRVVDTESIIGPEVRTPGRMDIVIDSDVIQPANVHFAPLLASLVIEADVFYAPLRTVDPPLKPFDAVVDFDDTIYAPVLTQNLGIRPNIWIDVDYYLGTYNIVLGQVLAPPLVLAADSFISPDSIHIDIRPELFSDTDVFYAETVGTIFPALFVDTNLFYTPAAFVAVGPLAYTDTDVFRVPTIGISGAVRVMTASRAGLGSTVVGPVVSKTQLISNIGAVS